jgi:hypothetical protein
MVLLEVVGNAAKLAPEHIADTCVNVGVVAAFTVTVTAVLELSQVLKVCEA